MACLFSDYNQQKDCSLKMGKLLELGLVLDSI